MLVKLKIIIIIFLVSCFIGQVYGQKKLLDKKVALKFEQVTLAQAIKLLEIETGVSFAYNSKLFSTTKKYNFIVENMSLNKVLDKLLIPQDIKYKIIERRIVLYKTKGYNKVTISGFISDEMTGEKLLSANVYEVHTYIGTISNVYGFFSLSLPQGQHEIAFSFVGYNTKLVNLDLLTDTVFNIGLQGNATISEIKVVANDPGRIHLMSSQMSRIDLPIDKIQKLPAFLGEVDIIKSLQLMPGIQSGSEGSSGLYVRGGGPDQNLILLDGVPIYNVNHLFGFFSVFNSSAIKNVTLNKGSFPARYGGRLSSVLDIRMKEGNEKEFHGNVKIGMISSNLNLEGPIVKDKMAFNISARRTYIDLLARPIIKTIGEGETMGYYFYDINAKVNHKISDIDRLYLSVYTGADDGYGKSKNNEEGFNSLMDFSLNWQNIISAFRWNHIFGNKLFSNTTLTYSKYKFNVSDKYESKDLQGKLNSFKFDYRSGIEDFAGKIDFDYFPSPSHIIKFGANYTNHSYRPGVTTIKEKEQSKTTIDTITGNSNIRSHEYYLYFEDNIEIGNRIKANVGVHYSGFSVQGKLFQSVQPRVSIRYLATSKLSFKAAYSKMSQYIHLLSSSTISLPTDLWLPITNKTKPQRSHQLALGTFYNIKHGIDFSIEGYYKKIDNLIEYKEGASFSDSNKWEEKIETGGQGWSYGVEFLLQKITGNTTGWIGYTLAWSDRKFDNLNFGQKYPARYDRRHDVGMAATHKFNDRIDIGATWVYGTGNAVTFSTSSFKGLDVPHNQADNMWKRSAGLSYFGGRNNYRMPAYHRLDFGINFHKKKKHGTRTWSVGAYNVYSRKNPFFIYKQSYAEPNSKSARIKQVSLFPIMPSVSYCYKF